MGNGYNNIKVKMFYSDIKCDSCHKNLVCSFILYPSLIARLCGCISGVLAW